MPGTDIDLVKLIQFNWEHLTAEEQQKVLDRSRDLIMLSLDLALEDAVAPQETPKAQPAPLPAQAVIVASGGTSAPAPADLRAPAEVVPFGDASNYRDYTYDDFARLCEDHGVPPTSGIGHWFGKSLGIEFDKSTPEIRRKVFAEMSAFYATQERGNGGPQRAVPASMPPMAVVQAPYVHVDLQACPSCGQPAKFVQGGISKKTGKPYSGFYACNKRPICKTYYQGNEKDITWTVDRDWTAAYNKTHGVGVS